MSRAMMRAAAVLMLHHQTMMAGCARPAPLPWYRAWRRWLRDRYNLVGYRGSP